MSHEISEAKTFLENGGDFKNLDPEIRNNPSILKIALMHIANVANDLEIFNPLSYAGPDALTDENIELAISLKQYILLSATLRGNKNFILKALAYEEEFHPELTNLILCNFSPEMQKDQDVIRAYKEKPFKILKKKYGHDSKLLSLMLKKYLEDPDYVAKGPDGSIKRYRFFAANIAILPSGALYEKEVRRSQKENDRHSLGIDSIISNLPQYPSFKRLATEINEINKYDATNPFPKAYKCTEYNILFIIIEGESIQIYFPDHITKDQFDKLSNLLSKLNNVEFHLCSRDEIADDSEDLYGDSKKDPLSWRDVLHFVQHRNIFKARKEVDDRFDR